MLVIKSSEVQIDAQMLCCVSFVMFGFVCWCFFAYDARVCMFVVSVSIVGYLPEHHL